MDASVWVPSITGLAGVYLTYWLSRRGVTGYRQRSDHLTSQEDIIEGLHDDLRHLRTDRDLESERRHMAEAERDAAYALLRGVNLGIPDRKLQEK